MTHEPLDKELSEPSQALEDIDEVVNVFETNAKTVKNHINEQKEKILQIVTEKFGAKAGKMSEDVDTFHDELHA